MKKFLLGVLVGLIITVVSGVVLFFASIRFVSKPPDLPSEGWLSLRIEGVIPEAAPVTVPLPAFEDRAPLTLTEIWTILNRAARDPRVKGVMVKPRRVLAGWGKIEEIRTSLEAVKKAGKPVYVWLSSPGTREYYLASGADRIFLSPEDFLDIKGLRIEAMYFKGTLDKIGVEVEIEHVGKYKDAGDVFTRTGMSPETRESLDALLDSLYPRMCSIIGAGRKLDPNRIRALIDQGPFLPAAAKENGFIDELTYEKNAEEQLAEKARVDKARVIPARDYLRATAANRPKKERRVAVLVAQGDILRGAAADLFGEEQVITPASISRLARMISSDPTIRGVILRVDSPGGDAIASDEILDELKKLAKAKPLVISMSDVAASGGYYISMTGDPVVAYPGTITGSIGVIYGKANLKGLYNKLGISKEILKRGKFADIDSEYQPLTPESRKKLRESIEFIYDGFLRRVSEGRRLKAAEVEPVAQGRVWIGNDARQKRLVDELGGLDKAIELLKAKSALQADEEARLVVYPGRKTLFDQLMSRSDSVSADAEMSVLLRLLPQGAAPWLEGGFMRVMPFRLAVR